MALAVSVGGRLSHRAEQVEQLRKQMASVSEKMAGKGGGNRRVAPPSPELSSGPDSLLPMPDSLAETASRPVTPRNGGGAVGCPVVVAEHGGGGDGGGRACAIVGQPDVGLLAAVEMGADLSRLAVIPEPGADPGRGGRGADGRHGSGGARSWRPVGARDTGQGGGGPRSAEGVHAAGHRRRLAGRVGPTGRQGQRLRGDGRRADAHTGVRADQPGAAGHAGAGTTLRVGACGRRMTRRLQGAGHLVHGLARGGRGGCGWSAPTSAGGGHAGQPGHRLLGGGPRGRRAPRPAPPGSPGPMSAVARRHRRSGARCPALRKRDGSGGRPGAACRGAAARACWCCRCAARPATSVPSRPPRNGWSMRWRRPVPNARWASPTSCPPRSSPHAPGGSSSRARMRCSCPRCRSGSWPPSRAWRRPAAKTWRICCGAWESETSGSSPRCPEPTWPPGSGPTRSPRTASPAPNPAGGRRDANPPAELDAVMDCDPPIDRVDAAAFAGRSLASELHRSLESAGVGCTRLAIHAVTANGEELNRVWRCAEPLTEDATADRVRWQLDGWLNRRNPERPADRADHRAAAATGGGGVGRGAATAAVGWHRRGGPAACPSGAGAGAGSARTGGRAGAGAQRRPWTRRTHHLHAVG